jgi:WD40 repeat protein
MYLAYGSASGSVDMSVVKEWNCLCTLAKHKKAVTGLAWGTDAGFLLSASMDRSIKKQSFK